MVFSITYRNKIRLEKIYTRISKMFDSERNKQHQKVLCNEIRRSPNETIKQLAVRIETLVRKAYPLNTHYYKNTKMTEILMMTLTLQLRKIAMKKRASHPSSIREPDLDFRKLVDKQEQAEITMKLEETENLKLQYVNRIETNTTNINNIQESDTDLIEKITEINQVQSNEETTSDPPGIDDTGNNELQLNQINCESSDTESDTENTISINMIEVENDYELIIYEQPFISHIYENQLELLHNYYIEPINTTQTAQEINEINTARKPNENDKTKCLNTNHIYQNTQKEQPREKIWVKRQRLGIPIRPGSVFLQTKNFQLLETTVGESSHA